MTNMFSKSRAVAVAVIVMLLAVFWKIYVRALLFETLGLYRQMQTINEFPYQCRIVRHSLAEGCEMMWLDDTGRALYATCANVGAHTRWNPSLSRFNYSGRTPGGDSLVVLNVDEPGDDGLFNLKKLKQTGYVGASGDGTLDLHGFDVEIVDHGEALRFWMINHRPSIDEFGRVMDGNTVGANSTVEIFELHRGEETMTHLRTISHPAIKTPNGLALVGQGEFVVTNDKTDKVGWRRELDVLIGGGNVVSCRINFETNTRSFAGPVSCSVVAYTGFNYPNGIVRGDDGLYYVGSSFIDKLRVMRPQRDGTLREVSVLKLGMPIDNLAVDARGDIFTAGFPQVTRVLQSFDDPYGKVASSTIFRIRKGKDGGYSLFKVLEDSDGNIFGGATVARHDLRTGRIFIGGALAPHITVCDRTAEEVQ